MSDVSGNSEAQVIYRREQQTKGAVHWIEDSAEEEVNSLLTSMESAFGDYKLEVQRIERIRTVEFQRSFESKKKTLEKRSRSDEHWKYNELTSFKREMRDKLLGTGKVLEKRVYVGLDSDKIAKGIAETGFASTKCRNNWFASGHYVTTHAWYAARYGLDGCYDDKGGILDPRCEVAVGKQGRLMVCLAAMSNVYPITRSCTEDHAFRSFAEAAKQGTPWSKWYNEGSSEGKKMKDGYDTHFVRVKKVDAGKFSNFQACQDEDVLAVDDNDIADELVILEEAQLLPEYCVYYCVRKVGTEGILFRANSPLKWEAHSSSCSEHSSTTGSSTSKSSTIQGLDSPRKVSVLLVFTEYQEQMYHKRDVLRNKGFTASYEIIADPVKFDQAVIKHDPSIIYIEGPSSGEWPWRRFRKNLHLIEELSLFLKGQWRGCVINFGAAEHEILEKVCDRHPGKLHLLTWANLPAKSDMNDLWDFLFENRLDWVDGRQGEKEAFEKAASESVEIMSDMLVMAPVKHPSLSKGKQKFKFGSPLRFPFRRMKFSFKINGSKSGIDGVKRAMRSTNLNFRDASVDIKVHTDPDVEMNPNTISNDDIAEFEHNAAQIFPQEVRGNGVGFRGPGCFRLRLDIQAFDWLCDRVDNSGDPLYFELPMAWGGGEVKVKKALLGETCWFEAVAHANDAHAICNHIDETLKEVCGKEVFEVRIETLANEVVVKVSGAELVGTFREKVANEVGWASEQTALFLGGAPLLNDSQSLLECGLAYDNIAFQATREITASRAELLRDMGKYEEAESMLRQILKAQEQKLGLTHPYTLTSYNKLASLLMAMGKYEEAEPMLRQALKVQEQELGLTHPYTLTSYIKLASLLVAMRKYEEAEPTFRQVLKIREQTLGPTNPDTLKSCNDLAALLRAMGKYEKAEPMFRQALEVADVRSLAQPMD